MGRHIHDEQIDGGRGDPDRERDFGRGSERRDDLPVLQTIRGIGGRVEPTVEPMAGSLELLAGDGAAVQSTGLTVAAITPDLVPVILQAVHGLTGVTVAAPEPGQIAAWTAIDSRLRPVRVILWPEPDLQPQFINQEAGDGNA